MPFSITPDPAYLYMSPRHQEALGHLLYGTGQYGGFVQLTGEVGTGKTTIVRTLLSQKLDNVDVAVILNPRQNEQEFVASICDELHIAYPKNATLKALVDALNAHLLEAHTQGRRTVVIIDEAQNLQPEVLEQVRLLTNLETHKEKLLRIMLVGQPELADLLEDLGRSGRQELLASLDAETAADALEEMDPEELGALLRETPAEQAAELVANMEPDEAVDALRDLDDDERSELLEHMEDEHRDELVELLEYRENTAGGFMTTSLVTATLDEAVSVVRNRLRGEREHAGSIDAIAVLDDTGQYLDDVSLFDLAIASPDQPLADLIGDCTPVTVPVTAEVREVASQLTESRRSSVVVIDDDGHPIGRILADDIIDALLPERGRFHFPRLLS